MNLEIELAGKLRGRFNLIVRDGKTLEKKRETGWFDNLILNAGLDRLATNTFMTAAQVGTSNVTPVATQTALSAYLAGTTSQQSSSTSSQAVSPYYGKIVRVFRFAAGVAAGTLAEVGIGWTSTTGNLFSRALILDIAGNPTTITVLSDEVLDVVYELRMYPDTLDKVFQAVISGITYDCVLRAANVTGSQWSSNIDLAFGGHNGFPNQHGIAYNGALGAITAAPSGTAGPSNSNATLGTYTNGTYFRTFQVSWGLNDGNLSGGITAVMMNSSKGAYKMSFSPAIAKDNTKTLTLTFKFTWARFTP